VVNDRSVNVYRMIAKAAGDPDFGFLHVIVGDMNVDDWFFDLDDPDAWDLSSTASRKRAYDEAEPWERGIFDALAELTEAERATAVAMHWGYFDETGAPISGRYSRVQQEPPDEPGRYVRGSSYSLPFLGKVRGER
jgi:hypothetical protein